MTRPIILITRPADDAPDTADRVRGLGFDPVFAPALSIHDTGAVFPDLSVFDGFIFSSAHGVRGFAARNPAAVHFSKTAYTVGDHTAAAARAAGFTKIINAAGTMRDLAARLRRDTMLPVRLLHLRGRDVRDDPAVLLPRGDGWLIDALALYSADPVLNLPAAAADLIGRKSIHGVLFYSARSAAAFVAAVQKEWPKADFSGSLALCIADTVLDSVRGLNWRAVHVAATPDQAGMMRLLESLPPMTLSSTTSQPNDPDALTNAGGIIALFGGIRPMATKMNVPVTTVQGWKKRNVIPGNRRADVMNAARAHQIDLSPVIANQNQEQNHWQNHRQPGPSFSAAMKQESAAPASGISHEVMMNEIKKAQRDGERRAIRKSVVASGALITVFVIFSALLITIGKQKIKQQDDQIASLQAQVADHPADPGVVETTVADLGRKFSDLRTRTEALQGTVADLKTKAENYIDLENSSLMDRIIALENMLTQLTASNPDLSNVMTRVQDMQQSMQGQQQMQATIDGLQSLVTGLQGRIDQMEPALAQEQQSDSALGQALQGVSPQELKAAAMLIGLSQFRDSLNRSGPFGDDLALLQTMLGDQDPELNAAIATLAPYAETGVLSTGGLSNELKGLAGDIVVASLSGQDVSVQDRALARFHDVLKVQKNGQPLGGTDTQSTVARAQAMLDAGNVDGAVAELQRLQGPARTTAQPLIDQAQATQMAHQVQGMLTGSIMTKIKTATRNMVGGSAPYTTPSSVMGPFLNTAPFPATP